MVRVDYILKNENPFHIEKNTATGIGKESIVPQMARISNKNYNWL